MAEKRCYTVAELQEILGSQPTDSLQPSEKEMNFAGSSWTAESTGSPRKVLTTGWINSLLKNNFHMKKVHRHSNAILIFPLSFQQEGRIDYE